MKILKTFLFVLLTSMGHLHAQMSSEVVKEDDFQNNISHILQHLDFREVQTNLLKERSFNLISMHLFDGKITDKNWVDINRFGSLYGTLYDASIDPETKLMDPGPAYMDSWKANKNDTTIPMAVLLYDYHQFKEDAIENNLLDTLNGQIYDVPGRTESPYEKKSVFAMAPLQSNADQLSLNFQFPAQLFHSNLETELDYLEIDFGNGAGYQPVNFDKELKLTYTEEGRKDIKVKATLVDGRVFYSHSLLDIDVKDVRKEYDRVNPVNVDIPATDEHAGATLNMFFSCPTDGLWKPLIVIDGWDPPQLPNRNFENMFDRFDFMPFDGSNTRISDLLETEGYDLIFIDPNYGSDYMERNAMAVRDAIRRINTILQDNGSPEPLIIAGASMGGVTGKLALLQMEADNEEHNTDLFMNLDGPLTGANVPLGLQHMVKHIMEMNIGTFWDITDFIPDMQMAEDIFREPATQQQLYFNIFAAPNDNPVHSQFYAYLHEFDDPQHFEYVAISNGSVNGANVGGRQRVPPATKFIDIDGSAGDFLNSFTNINNFWSSFIEIAAGVLLLTGGNLDLDVWSLPVFPSSNTKIYHGKVRAFILGIPVIFTTRNVYVRNSPALDSAPGSMEKIPTDWIAENNLEDIVSIPFNSTCFVPTVSSLDIYETGYTHFYWILSNYESTVQNRTQLDRYIASVDASVNTFGFFQENQQHVSLDARNSLFFISETVGQSSLASSTLIEDRIYNFGNSADYYDPDDPSQLSETFNRITQDLTIGNNGQIWVNRDGRIDYTDILQNPPNTTNSSFELLIRDNCSDNTRLTVADGGEFRVGQKDGASNTADVLLMEGSEIIIQDGGLIVVEEDSRIIIQDGATLIVEEGGRLRGTEGGQIVVEAGGVLQIDEGAFIDLHWHPSNIHIQEGGELIYNGPFKFEGYGYFQFDKNHIFTQHAEFVLSGQNDRFIRLNKGAVLDINSYGIDLKNGEVEYHTNASIRVAAGEGPHMENMKFDGRESAPDGNIALDIDQASKVIILNCEFDNLYAGININQANIIAPVNIWFSDFTNCGFGVAAFQVPSVTINNCHFQGLDHPSGTAIWLEDITSTGLYSSSISGYAPNIQGLGAIKGTRIENWYVSATDIIDNTVGLVAEDVNALRISSSLIENNSVVGIHIPPMFDGTDNETNVFLFSQTQVNNNAIGLHFEAGGGQYPNSTDLYGMLTLDCAELYNNVTGVLGEDVILNIDAFLNTNTTDPDLIRSNKIHGSGRYFDICYSELEDLIGDVIPASGNYWGGTTNPADLWSKIHVKKSSVGEGCPTLGHILDLGMMISEQPMGCNEQGPSDPPQTPDREVGFPLYVLPPTSFAEVPGQGCDLASTPATIKTDEVHYNGYNLFRAGRQAEARQEFEKTAAVSSIERGTASSICKHYINVAKVMAHGETSKYSLNNPQASLTSGTKTAGQEIHIFPNPAKSEFWVKYNSEKYRLKVYNLVGQLIHSNEYSSTANINTADWEQGLYLVELYDEVTKDVQRKKIMITK